MIFCSNCNKAIDIEEFAKMREDEITDRDKFWEIDKNTCMECRELIRSAEAEFSGDNSPMHPDETAAEFDEHEDHEPKD